MEFKETNKIRTGQGNDTTALYHHFVFFFIVWQEKRQVYFTGIAPKKTLSFAHFFEATAENLKRKTFKMYI